MPRPPAHLPRDLVRRPFLVAEAREVGLTAGRLRAADLSSPHRGVRVPGCAPETVVDRCRALLPLLPAGARFGDLTALDLFGVERPWSLDEDDRLHVEVSTPGVRPRIRGVVAHRVVTDAPVRRWRGLPVLAPATAWTRVAVRLGHVELVVLGDALCRRNSPIAGPDALAAAVLSLPKGARGLARLRAALDDVRPGTDSGMETRTRLLPAAAGIDLVVNQAVRDAGGRFVALPDLSDPVARVAVEYDGDVHRTDQRMWRRDVARRQALEALGWRVVTVTADDVLRHPDRMIAWIAGARRSQLARLRAASESKPSSGQ